MFRIQPKNYIATLAATSILAATSSSALAEVDWSNVLATYMNADGENFEVPQDEIESTVCNDDYVECNEDGSVTFEAPTAPRDDTGSSSDYRRAEMRVLAAFTELDDDGVPEPGAFANNFVLDTASSSDQDDAGGVNAVVAGSLSIDKLPETGLDETSSTDFNYGECSADFDSDYDEAVMFSQFHAIGDEPMRAYAVRTADVPEDHFKIWIIHEIRDGEDVKCPMEMTRPLALGERFIFVALLSGDTLWARVSEVDNETHLGVVDHNISDSGYDADGEYFYGKWGAYNSNNQGENEEDSSIVTYYDQRYTYNID